MTANSSNFSACVLIPAWGGVGVACAWGKVQEELEATVFVATPHALDGLSGAETLLLVGEEAPLLESLRKLAEHGFSHALVLDGADSEMAEHGCALLVAARTNPEALHLFARTSEPASVWSRLGLRGASGLRLADPYSRTRCYPLAAVSSRHCVMDGATLDAELLVKLTWAGVPVLELDAPGVARRPKPAFSLRRMHMYVRLMNLHWFLPPTFLEMATRRDFHALSKGERLRESFREVFLREPGTSVRIAASAGLGFFLALTPLWGFQILLTIYLSHRLKLSKTVALVCAQISIPPVIPLALYASLVLGRMLLGVDPGARPTSLELDPADLWPWIVGSFALASIAGLLGSATVWILVSSARRLRKRAKA